MCGIVGIVGQQPASGRLLAALKRLEYRGYDSAGIATIVDDAIERRRAAGKISELETLLGAEPLEGSTGIGHTRWATHGAPTSQNAHPHMANPVAIVHNGIIENFRTLREEAIARGAHFESETDSETIAYLIQAGLHQGLSPEAATRAAVARLEGAFAIACIFAGEEDLLIGARRGSPLVVGLGEGENILGSDAIAVAPFSNRVIYLEEGDIAVLTRTTCRVIDEHGAEVNRPVVTLVGEVTAVDKGNHRHFMQKEIYEQPETISHTVTRFIDPVTEQIVLPEIEGLDLSLIDQIDLIGCGTAHYAGRVSEYWFEQLAGVRAECDIASEFRYREPSLRAGGLAVVVSQSGETADTLAAMRYAKGKGLKTLGIVNVPRSTIAREVELVLPTFAGTEIGVASTKAFTAQLAALAALAIALARARGTMDAATEQGLVRGLLKMPRLITEALSHEAEIAEIASTLASAKNVLFLGRGTNYPLALEGALKLKEISYINAEGYAAGELKHGPIALVERGTPVIVLAPHDRVFEKTVSNMREVAARGGHLILISEARGHAETADMNLQRILVPTCDPIAAPIVFSIPIQLLAYHTAVSKGTDVDQPRNLAKSVTVE